jgi:cystathionine beta-synthase
MYNDDWMRENRFLVPEKITVRYVLEGKKGVPSLIEVDPLATVRTALDLIKEHNISQLPVMEKGKSVGSVEESDLMRAVLENPAQFDAPISSMMKAPFPTVQIDTAIHAAIAHLSKKEPAVLVEEDSKIVGVLTRYDVIEYMSR